MALVINSSASKNIIREWGDNTVTQIGREYPHPQPARHLLLQYISWQSKSMRKERYRITVGDVIPLSFVDGLPILRLRYPTDAEIVSMRRIHLTGSEVWDRSRYDRSPIFPQIGTHDPTTHLPPTGTVDIQRAYLFSDNDASDGTSKTGDCKSSDDSVDTDTIDDVPETTGQVSFRYNEVIREIEKLSARKELVRHHLRAVLKQLQEVSIRGDIERELISGAFGDDYPRGEYVTYHHGRHHPSYDYTLEAIRRTPAVGQPLSDA